MGWPEVILVKVRKEFVLKALAPGACVAELCRETGISRKTAYKWLARYKAHGLEGLMDRSRRPKRATLETTAEVALEVVDLRREHPRWGPKKIRAVLSRRIQDAEAPSERTIARILSRLQMSKPRRRPLPLDGPTVAPGRKAEAPNDLWTADFKGWWRTSDGQRFEPLTVRDAASRFVLASKDIRSNTGAVRAVFEELFEQYGLPRAIQTDNGAPFACTRALCGLSQLSAWWVWLGIDHVRSRPAKPQDNGGHERMHADLRADLEALPAASPSIQQALMEEWRNEFNCLRPHEALGQRTPVEVYRPSSRRLSALMANPFPKHFEERKVMRHGCFNYQGRLIFASRALKGYTIGLELIQDNIARVWHRHLLIGQVNLHTDSGVSPLDDQTRHPQRQHPGGRQCTGNSQVSTSNTQGYESPPLDPPSLDVRRDVVPLAQIQPDRATVDGKGIEEQSVTPCTREVLPMSCP
jgi:putative transposase